MATTDAYLGVVSGFLRGFVGELAKREQQERELLVNAIDSAVVNGTPETLALLNPEKLVKYGMDQLVPAYAQIASTVQKKRQIEQRRMEALAQSAESQARVGAATEETQISTAKLQEQRAGQQVAGGAIELERAEAEQQILRDNPKLLMLPFRKQQVEVQNIESQIQARTDQTKLEWAQLGEMTRHHRASEGIQGRGIKVGQLLETATMEALKGLSEEERNEVLLNRLAPGMESNLQRNFNMYNSKFENAGKTWQAVAKSINDTAVKEGKEPLTYSTEEAALSDMVRLNKAAAEQNSIRDVLKSKFGDERPEAPMFEVVSIPGRVFGEKWVKGYQLVTKQAGLMEQIKKELGIDLSAPAKPMEKKPAQGETKPKEEKSGRRTFVDPNRGRAQRGPVGETKEIK